MSLPRDDAQQAGLADACLARDEQQLTRARCGIGEPTLDESQEGIPADQNGQFETQVRSLYKQMARITIEPRWARYYDYTAGRVPEFLRKL